MTQQHTNRLIGEASPYLLQHAHNPVDWYPWGEEALGRARRENKPIFLSVGYSTCHWCHVMERESFENEEIARLLNEHFIAVKVDREERPDLDHLYMSFTQALTGQGGWPMNVFLTPGLAPFYAATYIPPQATVWSPGFPQILTGIQEVYHGNPAAVEQITEQVLTQVQTIRSRQREDRRSLDPDLAEQLVETLRRRYDPVHPGFGTKPKFPAPHNLLFLLNQPDVQTGADQADPSDEPGPLEMAFATLESMYRGGIYDHVGGGISRYSVDEAWLVPHFEKMLYDNAFLMEVAARAWQRQPLPLFRTIYDRTLEYLMSDLQSEDGLFCAAEDADSEGVEGKFYVFCEAEIDQIAGDAAEPFKAVFGVTAKGNFEGGNILNLIAAELSVRDSEEQVWRPLLNQLKAWRDQRIRPLRDDKILFSWNAMVVRALAVGSQAFADPSLLTLAEATMDRLLGSMTVDGRLHTSRRGSRMGPEGILDDYAFGIHALLALAQASQRPKWLLQAIRLTEQTLQEFYSEAEQAFQLAGVGRSDLILNPVDAYDSAIPSGNGIMALVLAELSLIAHEPRYRRILDQMFQRFSGQMTDNPDAVVTLVNAWQRISGDQELHILTGPDFEALTRLARSLNLPGRIQLVTPDSPLRAAVDFLGSLDSSDRVFLYHCTAGVCDLPREIEQS